MLTGAAAELPSMGDQRPTSPPPEITFDEESSGIMMQAAPSAGNATSSRSVSSAFGSSRFDALASGAATTAATGVRIDFSGNDHGGGVASADDEAALPITGCPNDCSGHGMCLPDTGECLCFTDKGFGGLTCTKTCTTLEWDVAVAACEKKRGGQWAWTCSSPVLPTMAKCAV